jgi:hypothetical protein
VGTRAQKAVLTLQHFNESCGLPVTAVAVVSGEAVESGTHSVLAAEANRRVGAVNGESALVTTGSQEPTAYWQNNQILYQGVGVCQCLLETASIRAVGDIQFCRDFLMEAG